MKVMYKILLQKLKILFRHLMMKDIWNLKRCRLIYNSILYLFNEIVSFTLLINERGFIFNAVSILIIQLKYSLKYLCIASGYMNFTSSFIESLKCMSSRL
jgi:hypothetical protein